ncbi:MAG: hypothetical protein KAX65_03280 [Caldilineaceae bacterium]|nr:hypothetical protein [Caldilineaceae bacterium]
MQQREVVINNDAPVPVGLEAPLVVAEGTITLGEVADGNTVTIGDGVHTAVTFEFDAGAAATGSIVLAAARPAIGNTITLHGATFELTDGTGATGDNVEVDISGSSDVTGDGVAILAAIKATIAGLNNAGTAGALDTDYTITLMWGTVGEAGNSTITKVGTNISVTSMTGGLEPGDAVTPGNVGVVAAVAGNASAANLLAAINIHATLDVTATLTDPPSATIELTNNQAGAVGNVTITKVGAAIAVTGMAGGLDAVDLYTIKEALDALETVTASAPIVTLTTATGAAASSGDNTIVAAPAAGTRIVVHDLQLQLEAATATTILIKSGSTTKRRVYCGAAGDGILLQYEAGKEFRLGAAEALILNLSGANSVGYTVRYTTEAA